MERRIFVLNLRDIFAKVVTDTPRQREVPGLYRPARWDGELPGRSYQVYNRRLHDGDGMRHWEAASYVWGLEDRKYGADSASERLTGSL